MKYVTLFFLSFFLANTSAFGQTPIRPLKELINTQNPAWYDVKQWIAAATNPVEVLPKDSIRADSALYQTQVTTHSPMGAVVYETGGILVDSGWIRILGSGSKRLNRSLMEWNKGKSFNKLGEPLSFLLIADDVLGGFFAINAGGIDTAGIGKVFYFAPDRIQWERTEMTYSMFLKFCFNGDLNKYYEGYRWANWRKDIRTLDGNWGMSIYPFLWSKEGQDINKDSIKPAPMQELWDLYFKKK